MSNRTYNSLWKESMMELLDLMEMENPEDPNLSPKGFMDWGALYVKYLQTFRNLEQAYDQMVHPQKRVHVKEALEICAGRMLEVRSWLVELNGGNEVLDLKNVLLDLKLPPEALEVPVPQFFMEERAKELGERASFLAALSDKYNAGGEQALREGGTVPLELGQMKEEEALALLQSCERSRQARQRVISLASLKRQGRPGARRGPGPSPGMTPDTAAIKIQAAVRGHLWRIAVRKFAAEELQFIGMSQKVVEAEKEVQRVAARIAARRKGIQSNFREEFESMVVSQKAQVADLEALDMRDTIQDKILAWALASRDPVTGMLPEIPPEEEGGSKLILNPPPPPPPPPPEPNPKQKPAAAKPKPKPRGKDDKPPPPPPKLPPKAFVEDVERTVRNFVDFWQERDEKANFLQRAEMELVRSKVRPLVFDEVRLAVDAEMRAVLANIKALVEAEQAALSGKKSKAAKTKKAKKAAKGGGDGKKKRKDPTGDRSVESLYAELVSNGVVRPCEPATMAQYLGTTAFRGGGEGEQPSLAQLRHSITQLCVLPLGFSAIAARAPAPRTLLLYGAPGSGKTLLSRAVASQVGATWFDLSPAVINGKYPGKAAGLLLHMVFKLARLMAPSVIYIDQVEQVFITDKRKAADFGYILPPSRIKKDLLKEVEGLQAGDRVLVLGNSSQPHTCIKKDEKALLDFFDKMLPVPMPDHASRRTSGGVSACGKKGRNIASRTRQGRISSLSVRRGDDKEAEEILGCGTGDMEIATIRTVQQLSGRMSSSAAWPTCPRLQQRGYRAGCAPKFVHIPFSKGAVWIARQATLGTIGCVVESAMTSRRMGRAEEQPLTPEELLVWLGHAQPPLPQYLDALREWGTHAATLLAAKGQPEEDTEAANKDGKKGKADPKGSKKAAKA
eukprot:jgi/Botrbrau1/21891/Bobra.0249s0020.1